MKTTKEIVEALVYGLQFHGISDLELVATLYT